MTQRSEYSWKVRGQNQNQGAEEVPADVCLLAVADRAWNHRKRQRKVINVPREDGGLTRTLLMG